MFDIRKWGSRSELAGAVMPADTKIRLVRDTGVRFLVPKGGWFYATLSAGGVVEHVRVERTEGDVLYVVRGRDKTEPQAWFAGTCIQVKWNPAQLCEQISSCTEGPDLFDTAGTHCLGCSSCITVDARGRVTAIDTGDSTC